MTLLFWEDPHGCDPIVGISNNSADDHICSAWLSVKKKKEGKEGTISTMHELILEKIKGVWQ
jgi:hypothetical protein